MDERGIVSEQKRPLGTVHKKGDLIGGKYEVYGGLGHGGFGVVYLVYSHETKSVFALKTFLDEYLPDVETRERFRREASVWVDLGRHPYIVRVYHVDEIAGRLYIAMEYIAPDEQGLKSLEDYLTHRPPDLAQSLRWAIQVCHGMEYAYSKGIRCHRDIKPANIMITQDGTVKITDFGLAGVLDTSRAASGVRLHVHQGRVGLSTMGGGGFGTPTHMPPEQFTNAKDCDERSDIYAFGVVLYQMVTEGKCPFLAPWPKDGSEEERMRFGRAMCRLHSESPVPRLNSPLSIVIQRCLEKEPGRRYQTFRGLRRELEPLLRRQTGEAVRPPEMKELEEWEWSNKGVSLNSLGRSEESIRCFDKALEINPTDHQTWSNKGVSLNSLGRSEEAVRCCDKALEIDPTNHKAWNNKGLSLRKLGRFEESIRCYDKALEINPTDHNAWTNKGPSLDSLGRFEEAVRCCDKALEINPTDTGAWTNKGVSLGSLGRFEESIRCYDKVLEINPTDTGAWTNKGASLGDLGRLDESIRCFDKALEINPTNHKAWGNKGSSLRMLGRFDDAIRCYDKVLEINPTDHEAWNNKGASLGDLGRFEEAVRCFDKALEIDPTDQQAWNNKGLSLRKLGRFEDAIRCYDKALKINPTEFQAWYNKAGCEYALGRKRDAASSFRKFVGLAPPQYAAQIGYARRRLQELGE
jgi:tetratricopeptide (TPR) repeat protein/tRNA A-37 threonylcarbamoyl transferase component Bud32